MRFHLLSLKLIASLLLLSFLLTEGQSAAPPDTKTDTKLATKEISLKPEEVPQYLQDISVTIRSKTSEGSGVLKVTNDGQIWVWTCGHVVASLRTERSTPDKKTLVEFEDAKIVKVLVEDGRKVGELYFDAEVIRYSDSEHGEDLALLRVRTKKFKPEASTRFYTEEKIPSVGTNLFHCGSLLGTLGSNSVTNGIVSQHGRIINGTVYDQTNCATFAGSSGGIICLRDDGRYVGMLVRGAGESFGLYVPIRRMARWAKKVGVDFALDEKLEVPSDEKIRKKPIDDSLSAVKDSYSKTKDRLFPTKEMKLDLKTFSTQPMPRINLLPRTP